MQDRGDILSTILDDYFLNFFSGFEDDIPESVYKIVMKEVERSLISNALKKTDNNQSQAANLLGLNRNTLRMKIKTLNIPKQNNGKLKK